MQGWHTQKCFGPKHFSDAHHEGTRGLEDLGEQARRAHDKIVNGEQTLAPVYWELGRILKLARKQLGRGQWGRFLASFGINRVRACRVLSNLRRLYFTGRPGRDVGRGILRVKTTPPSWDVPRPVGQVSDSRGATR